MIATEQARAIVAASAALAEVGFRLRRVGRPTRPGAHSTGRERNPFGVRTSARRSTGPCAYPGRRSEALS